MATSHGSSLIINSLMAGYGQDVVVKGVSLEVQIGEVAVLLGPNGAGKSTLLKALVGVVRCFEGSVHLGEIDITNRRTEDLAALGIAYVPQHDDVFGPLSVDENLEMGGYMLSRDKLQARLTDIYEEFPRLGDMRKRRASTLSGGERKLLAIARSLVVESRFLLLDEPTAGLSPAAAEGLLNDLPRTASNREMGVLMVEQRARAALEVSHSAAILVGGKVRTTGTSEDLLNRSDLADLLIGAAGNDINTSRHDDPPPTQERPQ